MILCESSRARNIASKVPFYSSVAELELYQADRVQNTCSSGPSCSTICATLCEHALPQRSSHVQLNVHPRAGPVPRIILLALRVRVYRGIFRVFYVTYCFCATEIKRYSYCRSVFVATTCHTSVVRSPKAPLRNAVARKPAGTRERTVPLILRLLTVLRARAR